MKTFKEFAINENVNGISASADTDLHVALNVIIGAADTMQVAHWNLRSQNFITLHPWLGESYGTLFSIADGIAEQIKIRNIDTPVTIVRQESPVVTQEQLILRNIKVHLNAVVLALQAASKNLNMDSPTVNLLEGWQGDVEKMRWFIESSITTA